MEGYGLTSWHYTHLLEYNNTATGPVEQTNKIEMRGSEGNLIV